MSQQLFKRRWSDYYQAVEGRPPRPTLLKALELFDSEVAGGDPRFAVDLGCGDGRDTAELLRRGWRVLGIDGEPEAIARLSHRPDLDQQLLETRVQRFEEVTLPADVDLINASFSLPFCAPDAFPGLWTTIVDALRPGGRFCGQLFGDRDTWAAYSDITSCTRSELDELLQPFMVEFFEEEEHPGTTALGDEKQWHIFQLVIKKK
ncbi:MAG: class I SAM-dependent methyltransferase [Synechococcales bacterium]|nr:class I SAM-dependent methyltransferase [Synechococcales bacterium]